jgi:preprotein translocase subunit SecG
MTIWMTVILAVQLLTAVVMIGLVLVQHGKGADMGASFGGGASGSLFGATGSANFLSRTTAVCATVFFCCTLALAYMATSKTGRAAATGGNTVLDQPAAAASAPATGAIPGAIQGAVPGAAPVGVPSGVPAPAAPAPGTSGVPAAPATSGVPAAPASAGK